MNQPISVEQIQEAVKALFLTKISKNSFSTDYICRYIQEYLQLTDPIPHGQMIIALRGVPHCVARPKMRQAKDAVPQIFWVFVQPMEKKKKSTRRASKKKASQAAGHSHPSVYTSLKMHRAS